MERFVIRPLRRSDRPSRIASCSYLGILFQPIRFKCHSAHVYRLLFCELVSVSDAHSYALHELVMHFTCRIRCAESSTLCVKRSKPCIRVRERLR